MRRSAGASCIIYDEHKWIPFSCFGDTGHFVTGVQESTADAIQQPY